MPIGTIKYINPNRAFGFISRDDKQPKVFVHVSEAQKAGLDSIEKGQRWSFDLKTDDKGQVAATNLVFEGYR